MFLHEINTFYFVTFDFSLEKCECSKVPLTGSMVTRGWGRFKQIKGVTRMGSAMKMIRRGEFAYYVTIGGNIIVYIFFAAIVHPFVFIYNIRI